MGDFNYNCNVSQGFNFQKDVQDCVGYIEYLKIGSYEVAANKIKVTDPTSDKMSGTIQAVGVIEQISWEGGYAQPLQVSFYIHTAHKSGIQSLLKGALTSTESQMAFSVYAYDQLEKKFFKAFHSNAVNLDLLIEKQGAKLQAEIWEEPNPQIMSPKVHRVAMSLVPQEKAMQLHWDPGQQHAQPFAFGVQIQ